MAGCIQFLQSGAEVKSGEGVVPTRPDRTKGSLLRKRGSSRERHLQGNRSRRDTHCLHSYLELEEGP